MHPEFNGKAQWPRVLIVTKTRMNDVDSAGASVRNWFGDCPRENLAQIYSGVSAATGFFGSDEYKLGPCDRVLGRLFFRMKRSDMAAFVQPMSVADRDNGRGSRATGVHTLMMRFSRWFLHSGLWEFLFRVRLSPQMKNWLERFRPHVLYVQGFDISFMLLPLAIHREYGIPICLHMVDDWPDKLYSGTVFSPLVRYQVRRQFRRLLAASGLRLTIGTLMETEYTRRYRIEFRTMMQCDEPSRFVATVSAESTKPRVLSIVYSGSVALGRWQAIIDLANAVRGIRVGGKTVELRVFAPLIDPEMREQAKAFPNLLMGGVLHDRDVAKTFAGADILFLPESFEQSIRSYTRLSVSTKAHLYMFSRRPILVYGPPEIGVVAYATSDKWAYVVTERGEDQLRHAVERLLSDGMLQRELIERASAVAAANHDAAAVRVRFRKDLWQIVSRGSREPGTQE